MNSTSTVTKRKDVLSWDEYFMSLALLSAKRSKDPNTQVGACIVDPSHKVHGIGYNGFPVGCDDDCLPWTRTAASPLNTKYMYVCHAELNAIMNSQSLSSIRGCTLYVTLFPCNECSKLIIQAGISHVVYLVNKHPTSDSVRASERMFELAGVVVKQYGVAGKSIVLTV